MDLKAGATRPMIDDLYIAQRTQADNHNAQIIAILQKWLGVNIKVASAVDDMRHNTDLITADERRIACRVRLKKYWRAYNRQFTIRHSNASGVQTELDKIRKGYGDLLFYGFESDAGNVVENWVIIDLHKFRELYDELLPPVIKQNEDRNNSLAAFSLDAMPAGIMLHSNWYRSP